MISRLAKDVKGTAAVEFALTVPLYIMLSFAVVQFGLFLWTELGLQHAVDLSARCASIMTTICPSASTTQTYAAGQAFGLSIDPSVFVVKKDACGQNVTVSYPFEISIPLVPTMAITINAGSCFPTN
jgi:Flp pilus assembly protein TadG